MKSTVLIICEVFPSLKEHIETNRVSVVVSRRTSPCNKRIPMDGKSWIKINVYNFDSV